MTERLPPWLTRRVPKAEVLEEMKDMLEGLGLHTVCESAHCPNIGECFAKKTATFMILGDRCTRNCRFCAVTSEKPLPVDKDEPIRVARAVENLRLKHVVITSVTRDDLEDGGAFIFASTISEIKKINPPPTIEVLIPDFQGSIQALGKVIDAHPEIIAHNVETVPRLYPQVRPQADYRRSLNIIKMVKDKQPDIYTKSGLMVGLGETKEEVLGLMDDLRGSGCDIITIGQYLRPSSKHLEVKEFIKPEVFEYYKNEALKKGFKHAASSPFVRSSYNSEEFFLTLTKRQ
ncbi:Lipoyl synthase [Koleobacter methoxysyntrophicus]|jgi:lipoic acid synthetase|uniref:Lipoyl synthase n=1 Tax=Koleobacter methoxysyntrophicus TaxID=2751313 RepID=A0A8A0RPV4_9FIRM|nr:lipoyl synthase [Koleobacter methoxysyntrophicus]QSQ09598.1 Lipoyl synthase [Koleobacter methoxysyntrophicus]